MKFLGKKEIQDQARQNISGEQVSRVVRGLAGDPGLSNLGFIQRRKRRRGWMNPGPLWTAVLGTCKGGREARDGHLVQGWMKPKPGRKGEKPRNWAEESGSKRKFGSIRLTMVITIVHNHPGLKSLNCIHYPLNCIKTEMKYTCLSITVLYYIQYLIVFSPSYDLVTTFYDVWLISKAYFIAT